MTAGILHGAPVTTLDLDIVQARRTTTSLGDLDCLGAIAEGLGFEQFLPDTIGRPPLLSAQRIGRVRTNLRARAILP